MPEKTKVVFSFIRINFSDGRESEYSGADGKAVYRILERAYVEGLQMAIIPLDDSDSVLHLPIQHITKFEVFNGTEIRY